MGTLRKKIAILCDFPVWIAKPDFPKRNGHYAVWLTTLYDSFETCPDFEIHWVVLSKAVKKTLRFTSKKQFFHIVPAQKKTIALYTFYLLDRYRVNKELSTFSPDIIHTWGTEYCYGLCGKDSKNKNWLHSVQGLLKAYLQRSKLSRYHKHHSFYEPDVLKKAPYITVESPWAGERVQEFRKISSPIIWEYAVEDVFFNIERTPSEKPSCLYCGTDTAIKNIDTLVKIFSRPELSHITLYLAGPTAERWPNLPSNIIALGRQSRENIAQLLSQTWCLIHLSFADTGPTAVKEARVMRVPVIISDQCGSKQYIDHGKSGFIVEPTDIENVIKHVLLITENLNSTQLIGDYKSQICKQQLSSKTMITRIVQIYNKILENNGNVL